MPQSSWDFNGRPWYKSWEIWFMVVVGMLDSAFLFIQAGKSFSERSAQDLSMPAFLLLVVTSIIWIVWSVVVKEIPVLVSGLLQNVGAITVLVAIFLYGSDSADTAAEGSRKTRLRQQLNQRLKQKHG